MTILLQFVLLGAGFLMLSKGADYFVDGASSIAAKLRVPQLVIGLTIVAMGTSAPEAAISISSAIKENTDITIGNIIGSNLLNLLVILGVTAVITTLPVNLSTIRFELPFVIGLFILFTVLGLDGSITPPEGLFLWFLFICYMIYLVILARNTANTEESDKSQHRIPATIFFTLGGLALITLGSDITVDAAVNLAKTLGLSQRFIGLTIVSLGTTLPEQMTAITAARANKPDIAMGNVVGSCIFNILFVIGSSSIVVPIPFSWKLIMDSCVTVIAATLVWLCCVRKRQLNRRAGFLLLGAYLIYFFVIII